MLNHHFRIGLNSFYQVNSEVAQVVYQDIIQFVIPQGITLDLYSGIGIITILVAQKSSQVYGVEINRSAFADAHLIGGYELIHMNDQEQIRFKKERFINDFWQIAKTKITDLAIFWGPTRFKYRNKITLHDGHFYQKQTHKPIVINDYLLSDIKYDSKLPGTIIYRQLDSLIFGSKGTQK